MKLISCTSNQPLAEAISNYLGIPLTEVNVKRFADQEIFLEVLDNVRGEDVFVIQSTSYPANDHMMEMLIMIDALKRGSAKRITAVIPYFGYARQDRKTSPRSPISAKLVANLITTAGADRVLTIDLHAGQIQGFFDIPVDNLFAGTPLFVPYIKKTKGSSPLTVVSPDVGGVVRARAFANRLECDLAIIDKRREKAGVSEVMNVIGDVAGKECILIDDMVDSAGTICNAAQALIAHGATSVRAIATHGVFSGAAVERIEKSPLTEMVVTDSISASENVKKCKKIKYLTTSALLGEAVLRISEERSVSSLFSAVPA
jgi:ribose-phosphate pyrophosphokinase